MPLKGKVMEFALNQYSRRIKNLWPRMLTESGYNIIIIQKI